MKKIFALLLLVLVSVSLSACGGSKSPILISKYFEAINGRNNAIELYNTSNKSVDLKSYKLDIYINGSIDNIISIPLSGKIGANDYFIITREGASIEALTSKSDFSSEDLAFNGDDPVILKQGKTIVDAVGSPGYTSEFGKDVALFRKLDKMTPAKKFVYGDFVLYHAESYSFLKTTDNILDDETLLKGPKLTDEDYAKTFIDQDTPNLAAGGVVTVTLAGTGDGDTANFRLEEALQAGDDIIPVGTVIRVRFYYIDTPEVINGQEKPFGKPASNFTSDILRKGTKIELQSIAGTTLTDGFGRYLANVWVDGNLVAHYVVKNGLSKSASDYVQAYKNVLYYGYLKNAEFYAQQNGFALHGELDPCWNYETSKLKPGTCDYYPKFR